MKIVFMGTPDFAVPCLQALIDSQYEVSAVITQPDRAKGRGNKLTPPPVKVLAESHNIPVHQPEKVKAPESVALLRSLAPDLIVVVAFGQILSQEILDIPPYGCVNVHASLLPRYRGAAPINWCIINGDKMTGVTTMYMNKGLDTGDMIIKHEVEIGEQETYPELYERLSALGAQTLIETIKLMEEGKAPRTPQNNEESTHAPMLDKALGKIDWSKDAAAIQNLIRGTYPWPAAYSSYEGKTFKIMKAEAVEPYKENDQYGIIADVQKDYLLIACKRGFIRVFELQFENEKRMGVEAYMRGHTIEKNKMLQ